MKVYAVEVCTDGTFGRMELEGLFYNEEDAHKFAKEHGWQNELYSYEDEVEEFYPDYDSPLNYAWNYYAVVEWEVQ